MIETIVEGEYLITKINNKEVSREINSPVLHTKVIQSVTRRQSRQALLLANLLGNVQPLIDAITDPTEKAMTQIAWDDSLEFQRNDPFLLKIATAMNLSEQEIDELFITASGL